MGKKADNTIRKEIDIPRRPMTTKEFCTLMGISAPAVSKMVKNHTLVRDFEGNIDPDDALNFKYINSKLGKQLLENGKEEIVKRINKEQTERKEAQHRDMIDRVIEDQMSEAELKIIKLEQDIEGKRLKNERERKEVVPVKLLEKVFTELHTVDIQELLPIADSFPEDALALCGVEDHELKHKLCKMLKDMIYRALNHRKRIMVEFSEDPFREKEEYGADTD